MEARKMFARAVVDEAAIRASKLEPNSFVKMVEAKMDSRIKELNMIKTICFDLGGEKELYLTIDEIIKLQAAFRFVCVDKYTEPAKPVTGYGFETFAKEMQERDKLAKPLTPFGEEYARALKFREERGLGVTTEELEQQMQEQFHRMRNGL